MKNLLLALCMIGVSSLGFAFDADYTLKWKQPDSHHKYLYNIDVYIIYDGGDSGPNKVFSDLIFVDPGTENVSYLYQLRGAGKFAYPGNLIFVISPCREYFNGSSTSWYCSGSTTVTYPIADARPQKIDDIFVDEDVLNPL